MNQNFSNINAQTVDGPLGSFNIVNTHSEQHIYQTSISEERNFSIPVLLSQINTVITRPQTCRLNDHLKISVRSAALAIPELPIIESIVFQSPPQPEIVLRNDSHVVDLEATAAGILQVQGMVQTLSKPNIDDELTLWQMLAMIFGSLGSRFADMGWFVGALRMSYHEVQMRCALANFQSHPTPADLSRSSITPVAPPYYVELLNAIAKLLHHRSLYSANQFCFNHARRASKQAIRIQSDLCMHEPENMKFKSALSWMEKHFDSFKLEDAAYNVIVHRALHGINEQYPADVTKSDILRATIRYRILVGSGAIAVFFSKIQEYLAFKNRRF